jgi:NAD(P)-dependent dehydrogenase (short-subunit alcohol dehydrogenase family)
MLDRSQAQGQAQEIAMKDFRDKVAVVTGAASGIGRAIAERCAQEGMTVVLAGINETNLTTAETELTATGATVISVRTDVAKRSDVEALAQRTLDAFGAVHLLVNNAGVGAGTSAWVSTWSDWEWVMNVNLWGVIYCVKVFTPIMLAQNDDCHIVNMSSIAGLIASHPIAPYHVTKHAVVALSENLYYSLAQQNARVKVSVLCPGFIKTRILECGRNRPPELQNDPASEALTTRSFEAFRPRVEAGVLPKHVADDVFRAIREEQFYIISHASLASVQKRMESILQQRNPT